ncbi:hypothetical protein [Nitrosopumilus spindle-shaped virus]|uniref:Uncharacterized protein n=1 Tax=Nitrosopumilus spindle-shaped virus TaxID=2508184 RepID=A0A514K366_9VIRU|nr:hypothetical protein [Nitrosopumilus spindle-shaped virus]
MWFGKIAIIMYIFSTALLFSGYYLDIVFNEDNFNNATYAALDALANKNNIDQTLSADLIFGDFIAGVKVLFGIVTGDTLTDAFHLLPNFSAEWDLLIRLIFTLSSALLWVFVVTGRSL